MAESFSPFLQSHSTTVWLSSRPTEASRFPSAVEGKTKAFSTARTEPAPALVQWSLALVSNMKDAWWVWSKAGDSPTLTYRSQRCLCLGPIKGGEWSSSTLKLSDCRLKDSRNRLFGAACKLGVLWICTFLLCVKWFFCSPVKAGHLEEFRNTESMFCWICLDRRMKSDAECYQRSPERTLRAGGNPSTQTWVLTFLCPICGWRNLCPPG